MTDFKESQYIENRKKIDIGWTEALCKEMDEKAQEHHTCKLTKAERLRYKSNWSLGLNSSGKNSGPLDSRPVFRAAVAF